MILNSELQDLLSITRNKKTFSEMSSKEFCKECLVIINGSEAFHKDIVNIVKQLSYYSKYSVIDDEIKADILQTLRNLNLL
jgi:hypothetical protein